MNPEVLEILSRLTTDPEFRESASSDIEAFRREHNLTWGQLGLMSAMYELSSGVHDELNGTISTGGGSFGSSSSSSHFSSSGGGKKK